MVNEIPENFDIFIPIGNMDEDIAQQSIDNKRKVLTGLNNIYYYSDNQSLVLEGAVQLKNNPTICQIRKDIELCSNIPSERRGWYFQQLLTMNFHDLVPSSRDQVVFCCCDVFFLRDQRFFIDFSPIITLGASVVHEPFFSMAEKIFNSKIKNFSYSGIGHYFPFTRSLLTDLHQKIFKIHGDNFNSVVLKLLPAKIKSGFSEYETLFSFLLLTQAKFYIRSCCYLDTEFVPNNRFQKIEYVANHWYLRDKRSSIKTSVKLFLLYFICSLMPVKYFLFDAKLLKEGFFLAPGSKKYCFWHIDFIFERFKQNNHERIK